MNKPMSPENQQVIRHSIHSFHVCKRVKCETIISAEYNQKAFTYLIAVINVHSLQIVICRQLSVRAIRGRFWAETKDKKKNYFVKQRQLRNAGFLGASEKGTAVSRQSSCIGAASSGRIFVWFDIGDF